MGAVLLLLRSYCSISCTKSVSQLVTKRLLPLVKLTVQLTQAHRSLLLPASPRSPHSPATRASVHLQMLRSIEPTSSNAIRPPFCFVFSSTCDVSNTLFLLAPARSDWHRINLKRKVVGQHPVDAAAADVLTAQEKLDHQKSLGGAGASGRAK